jgi:hypothetical protein
LVITSQQALLDHRGHEEFVEIFVDIQLTDSYGPLTIPPATTRSRSAARLISRSCDFWQGFKVQIYSGNRLLAPSEVHGHPNYICGDSNDCSLTGATIEFDFLADALDYDTATIQISPPEGEPVSVAFDLLSLR